MPSRLIMDMHDPCYLRSVVEAIAVERPPTFVHDLLDAYATFVNRVRSQSHLLEACSLLPALEPLLVHKDSFIRALRRDVRLAHVDPFSRLSSSLGETCLNIKIDAKQYARDSSLLCHHALCVLTTILRFPAFHLVFPEYELSLLFGDVLDILLADQLPVLNKAKTYSLSLWVMGCHRLPVPVLGLTRDGVFSALQRSLDSARQPDSVVLDGLKAISHTIERHPSGFLDILFPLLPHVITNLNCKSFQRCLHACIALGKFANALIHQTELSLTKWRSLSDHITSFLESYCDESRVAPGDTSFSCMIRTAFSSEAHLRHRDAPIRTLAVLASLVILCGPSLYTKPTVLHFILQSLAISLTHKRSIVRVLHPHVWRCFVWTFSQMLLSTEDIEPALVSSAFYVIKQEVSGGIGIALASVLLSDRIPANRSDERKDRVSQALSVIKAMVRAECKHTRQEGFMFLQAFANDAQVRHQISHNVYEIPVSVLLNGVIIRAEWDSLSSTIRSIPKVPVSVHWLEETEIARNYKALLVIWKLFASRTDRKDLSSGLVDVWLSILLACSHQLECEQCTTATTEMLGYTAAVIVEFLPSLASGNCQPDWGSWSVQDQLCSLTFIDRLWSAMRQAFVVTSLAEAAELILTSVLKYAFHVLDHGVQILWGRLCANLMTIVPPSFLRDTHNLTTSQLVIRSQRELWGVIATSLSSSEIGLEWKELVKFLAIPICTWVLSEPESEAWGALLRNAIAISGGSAPVIGYFVSQCFHGKDVETWDSIISVLGYLLTHADEYGDSSSDELLSMVDFCLSSCYSRARYSPEVLTQSLGLLNVIRDIIASAPSNVMRILRALCHSLRLWIEDHAEVMSNDEYNSVAISLYCEALKALEVIPLSMRSLQDIESFLVSGFSRIPVPAIAPFAFERFWRATYHGRSDFCNILPPKIKSCLTCFVAAYGGDLADGLSLATGSQSQSISNGSQVHSPTGHQYKDTNEFDFRVGPFSGSINVEPGAKTEVVPHQQIYASQVDIAFSKPSSGSYSLQPTVLRQLQEYTSQMDASPIDDAERSISSPRILSSPISPLGCAKPRSHLPEKIHSYVQGQKRKATDPDDITERSRNTLRSVHNLDSEPATRDITPVDVLRTNSVPLKKRKVFDGVYVPTFHEVSRRKLLLIAETSKNTLYTERDCASVSQTYSSRGAQRKSRTPTPVSAPSIGSDEDDLDWENIRIDVTSETDIDRSLANAYPSSPSQIWTSAPCEPGDESYPPRGLSLSKAMSQGQNSPSIPARPSLRTAKTAWARLDALQDVYFSVANGASQIPVPELIQATKLVHQIGAVLTEQVDKKLVFPG